MNNEGVIEPIRLGDQAPDFEAVTTDGPIQFSSWQDGRWTILFSHPADFTPVCTTEFVEFSRIQEDLDRKGVALIGCSVDSLHSHIAWLRDIEERFSVRINFPVIADLDQSVSRLYGMVQQPTMATAPVRTVFFIDGARIVRAMIAYPPEIGRSFAEIVRVIDALQAVDEHGVSCPANWCPGEEVIVPPPATKDEAQSRVEDSTLDTPAWYLARRRI
ncbi:MAG: peroxiredoxin [Planctomycetota bacterium]|nr:peroxiredoxin [Planctomycetota bacterium]